MAVSEKECGSGHHKQDAEGRGTHTDTHTRTDTEGGGKARAGDSSDLCALRESCVGSNPTGVILSTGHPDEEGEATTKKGAMERNMKRDKSTHRGARTHDHKVKGFALCRLS